MKSTVFLWPVYCMYFCVVFTNSLSVCRVKFKTVCVPLHVCMPFANMCNMYMYRTRAQHWGNLNSQKLNKIAGLSLPTRNQKELLTRYSTHPSTFVIFHTALHISLYHHFAAFLLAFCCSVFRLSVDIRSVLRCPKFSSTFFIAR